MARAPPKQSNGQKPPTHGSRSVLDLADSGMTGIDWFEVMQRYVKKQLKQEKPRKTREKGQSTHHNLAMLQDRKESAT